MAAASRSRPGLLLAARSRLVDAHAARAGSERAHRRALRQPRIQESDPSRRNARGRALPQPGAPHASPQHRSAAEPAPDSVLAVPARPGRRRGSAFRADAVQLSAMPTSPTTATSPRCVPRWSGCPAVPAIRAARHPAIPSMPCSSANCVTLPRRWCAAATAVTRAHWTRPSGSSAAHPDAVLRKQAQAGAPATWMRAWLARHPLRRPRRLPRAGRAAGGRAFRAAGRDEQRPARGRRRSEESPDPGHDVFGRARQARLRDRCRAGIADRASNDSRWRPLPHRRPARGPVPRHPAPEPRGRGASGLGAVFPADCRNPRRTERDRRDELPAYPRSLSARHGPRPRRVRAPSR